MAVRLAGIRWQLVPHLLAFICWPTTKTKGVEKRKKRMMVLCIFDNSLRTRACHNFPQLSSNNLSIPCDRT